MSFDKIFDLTAGAYFNICNKYIGKPFEQRANVHTGTKEAGDAPGPYARTFDQPLIGVVCFSRRHVVRTQRQGAEIGSYACVTFTGAGKSPQWGHATNNASRHSFFRVTFVPGITVDPGMHSFV